MLTKTKSRADAVFGPAALDETEVGGNQRLLSSRSLMSVVDRAREMPLTDQTAFWELVNVFVETVDSATIADVIAHELSSFLSVPNYQPSRVLFVCPQMRASITTVAPDKQGPPFFGTLLEDRAIKVISPGPLTVHRYVRASDLPLDHFDRHSIARDLGARDLNMNDHVTFQSGRDCYVFTCQRPIVICELISPNRERSSWVYDRATLGAVQPVYMDCDGLKLQLALQTYAALAGEQAIPILQKYASSEDYVIRWVALKCLLDQGDLARSLAIRSLGSDPHPDLRRIGKTLLDQTQSPRN